MPIARTTASRPRRPGADPLRNVSNTVTSTFAADGFGVEGVESKTLAIQAAIAASAGRTQPKPPRPARPQQPVRPGQVIQVGFPPPELLPPLTTRFCQKPAGGRA